MTLGALILLILVVLSVSMVLVMAIQSHMDQRRYYAERYAVAMERHAN